MDDLNHIEGKAVRSIEQNNSGLNSYLIIKFTDDSKLNVSGYPHQDNGVAQLDIELDGIKLPEIKNRKISTIEEEFDGQMDKLIIKFKQGGRMVIGAFNSKEDGTAGLETAVYVENKKKFVKEALEEDLGKKPPAMYPTGRAGNYIMNSPQYEDLDPEEEEKENKSEKMKKFVSENLNEFADWYDTEPVEYDDEEMDGPEPVDLHREVIPQRMQPEEDADEYYPEDELDMDDVEEVDDEDDWEKPEMEDDEEVEVDGRNVFDTGDDEDEIEISSVDYDEVESLINNLLQAPEFNREALEFRLKSGEEIEGVPMAKMSGGTAVLFKTEEGDLRKIALADIILESNEPFKWVRESLYEAKRKKKFKPVDRGKMKMVKVDDKTTIEVPESVPDEEAIRKHKEKMEARGQKW